MDILKSVGGWAKQLTDVGISVIALGIVLDRIQNGKQFEKEFENSKRVIIPSKNGKNVI